MESLFKIHTLGIAAPAGCFERACFERGVDVLAELGFKLKIDSRVFAKTGYLAGTDEARAALLTELMDDDEADAVICARGGYGCMRLLPLLDLKAMALSRKPIIGFSDCTALFCALYAAGARNCWHGPVVTQMGDLDKASLDAFKLALRGGPPAFNVDEGVCLQAGEVVAPFFGGNLAVLAHMAGTPYFPNLAGHVLLLEEQNEPLYKIDRMLTQLKLMGVLNGLAGVVLGAFINCGEIKAVYARLTELLDGKGMPVLAGFPAGHAKANVLLPLGAVCALNSAAKTLVFNEPGTGGAYDR